MNNPVYISSVLVRGRAGTQNAYVRRIFRDTESSHAGTSVPTRRCRGVRPPCFVPPLLSNQEWCNFHVPEPVVCPLTVSKQRPGIGSLEKPKAPAAAGLRQPVRALKRNTSGKLLRSGWLKALVRPSFVSGGIAGGFALLCTFPVK